MFKANSVQVFPWQWKQKIPSPPIDNPHDEDAQGLTKGSGHGNNKAQAVS